LALYVICIHITYVLEFNNLKTLCDGMICNLFVRRTVFYPFILLRPILFFKLIPLFFLSLQFIYFILFLSFTFALFSLLLTSLLSIFVLSFSLFFCSSSILLSTIFLNKIYLKAASPHPPPSHTFFPFSSRKTPPARVNNLFEGKIQLSVF